MKRKLYNVLMVFVIFWTMGQVFQSGYSENLVYATCMAIAYAIWAGVHSDIKLLIQSKLHKARCKES